VWIEDVEGNHYLDAAGSVHVVSIGHGVAEVAQAMAAQANTLSFASSRFFVNGPQLELAELVAGLAPDALNGCYFASGGSEAIELALQIAAYYQSQEGMPSRHKFIGQWRSYHGATMATISLGGHYAHRERIGPNLIEFPHLQATPAEGADSAEFASALDALIRQEGPSTVCALVVEPITGTTSGAIVPPPGWWEGAARVCREHGVLLIADEVVTGFGRTGRPFGIQHWDVQPDLMVSSKGISSGYAPLAAIVVHDRIASTVQAADQRLPLRLTYSANPISCAAGLTVQRIVQREGLMQRCAERGDYLMGMLNELSQRCPLIGVPRGKGLLIGLPIWKDAPSMVPFSREENIQGRIVTTALQQGLLIVGGTGSDKSRNGDHVMVSPPFTISGPECDLLVEKLESVLEEVAREAI